MATLQEIAHQAGVTTATVSNVLSGRVQVQRSDAVKRARRIQRIARQLGYRPNAAARATRTGRTGCIGMLISANYAYSVHMPDFENGVVAELNRQSLYMAKDCLVERSDGEVQLPRLAREHIADGLLINYAYNYPANLVDLIDLHRIPAIWINSKRETNCVRPDDYGAALAATQRLIAAGHQRIACVDPSVSLGGSHYSVADRRGGYEAAMAQAGLPPLFVPHLLVSAGETVMPAIDNAMALLSACPRPTAVLGLSNGQLLLLAAARLGLRVPQDLSLLAFSNRETEMRDMPYTRMLVPFRELGKRAVQEVMQIVNDGETARPCVVVDMVYQDGGTIGPCHG